MEKGRKEITERVKDRSLSEEELKAVSGGYYTTMYSYRCLECNWISDMTEDKAESTARRDQHSEQCGHYNFEFYRDTGVWV